MLRTMALERIEISLFPKPANPPIIILKLSITVGPSMIGVAVLRF